MFGYVDWQKETRGAMRLNRENIGGVAFAVLTVCGRGGFLFSHRLRRAAGKMQRWGVRQVVCPPDFPREEFFAPVGIDGVPEQELRRALLGQLLDQVCAAHRLSLRRGAAALIARRATREVWQAGEALAQRVRYVILCVGQGGDALGDHLRYTYGISAAAAAPVEPSLCLYYTDLPREQPFSAYLCLGEHCAQEQTLRCTVSEEWRDMLGGKEITTQLLAALFAAGRIRAEDIKVESITFPA